MKVYRGRVSATYPAYPDGPLARTQYIIGRDEGATPAVDRETLERGIAAIISTWSDSLRAALDEAVGGSKARTLAGRYAEAFSAAYREAFTVEQAINDIDILWRLSEARPRAVDLYRRERDSEDRVNLKVFSAAARCRSPNGCRCWRTLAFTSLTSGLTALRRRARPRASTSGCTI